MSFFIILTLMSSKNTIEYRYQAVKNRINSSQISLLAVSKKQSIDKIKAVYGLGQRLFGESYIQEAVDKIQNCSDLNIEWHFIGPIQSNKTKYIAQYFDWVQSVDSLKLLTRLENQRLPSQKKLNVLLQLKVGDEHSKRGFSAEELLSICKQHYEFKHLKIRGLMSIPPPADAHSDQVTQFEVCKKVFNQMQTLLPVDTLSMGMSGDLEAAIECGSTMVRIGTDIFGARVEENPLKNN